MLQHRTDSVEGFTVDCYELGQGQPLVFLHGWSVHAGSARALQETLSATHRVIVPSHIGFGHSSDLPKRMFGVADYAKLYRAWPSYRQLKNIVLVGHSLGGAIAQAIAADASPGTIQRLVLIDALGSSIPRSASGWAGQWLIKEARNIFVAPRRQLRYMTVPFLQNLLTKPRSFAALAKLSTSLQTLDLAPRIHVMTTIVWGEQDRFVPIVVGKTLQGVIPNATLVTVPGGHDWPLLHPERLVPLLQA